MWPQTSATYLAAARTSGRSTKAIATHVDPATGIQTDLPVLAGTVVDDVAQPNRRTLTLTCPPHDAIWTALAAVGGEITVTKATRYIGTTLTETIPMGVFIVDQDQLDYDPVSGSIQVTAPDRWLTIQRNRFLPRAASIPSNQAWQEIKRLVEGAWPNGGFPGWALLDESATTKVGAVVYSDGQRDSAIKTYLTDNALEMFFDRQGMAVLQPVPVLTTDSTPVWTSDMGVNGVMVGATLTRDRSLVRNVIVVTTSATDLTLPPVVVSNTDVSDPLSSLGVLGTVPDYYSSPTLRTTAQMLTAGHHLLREQMTTAQQVTMSAAPNDALDTNDVVVFAPPQGDADAARPPVLHMLSQITHQLVDTSPQQMLTQSTRPPSFDEGSS